MEHTAKSVIFDIADNWGRTDYISINNIRFKYNGSVILNSSPTVYATSEYSSEYAAALAFDTDIDESLSWGPNCSWATSTGSITNQRLVVVFDSLTTFDEISIDNGRLNETRTDNGAKTAKIYTSQNTITSTTYGEEINSSNLIFSGIIDKHPVINKMDYHSVVLIDLNGSKVSSREYTAKSVVIDIHDHWGHTNGMGVRSIDFYYNGSLIPMITTTDFLAYASGTYSSSYLPSFAFDTTKSKTGTGITTCWVGVQYDLDPQRLIIVFNSETTFDEIKINNYHENGTSTTGGIKTISIYASTDTITDTTYNASISNSVLIFDDVLSQHILSNIVDDFYVNLLTYEELRSLCFPKSVIFDFADNWGATDMIGVRQIDFFYNNNKINLLNEDFVGYETTKYSTDYYAKYAFITTTSKIGAGNLQVCWLSQNGVVTNQRLIIVFDTQTLFDKIVVNNFHGGANGGEHVNRGVKNTKVTISTDTITDTTYNSPITNSTLIFNGFFPQHVLANVEDDKTVFQSNFVPYKTHYSDNAIGSLPNLYDGDHNTYCQNLSYIASDLGIVLNISLVKISVLNNTAYTLLASDNIVFRGSNDSTNGVDGTWETIYTFSSGDFFEPSSYPGFVCEKTITHSGYYQFYKLEGFTASNNTVICEWELYGVFGEVTPVLVSAISSMELIWDLPTVVVVSIIEALYDFGFSAIQAIEEKWGIKTGTSFSLYYGDATQVRKAIQEYYFDAYTPKKSIILSYSDAHRVFSLIEESIQNTNVVSSSVLVQWECMIPAIAFIIEKYGISSRKAINSFVEIWDLYLRNNPIKLINAPYNILDGNSASSVVQTNVIINGKQIDYFSINISFGQDQYVIVADIALTSKEDFVFCNLLDDAYITINSDTYFLFIDSKSDNVNNEEVEYKLQLVSPAAKLDAPYSDTIIKSYTSSVFAKDIIEEMALVQNITVDYQILNWKIESYSISISDETPYSVIKKIANAVGAIAQSKPDGTLEIVSKYPIRVPDWSIVTPDYILSMEEDLTELESEISVRDKYTAYVVTDQGVSAESISLEEIDIDDTTKILRGYRVPFENGIFPLRTSGKIGVSIDTPNESTFLQIPEDTEEWEIIEFIDWTGKTSKPVYEIVDWEWVDEDLGDLTDIGSFKVSEDGTLEVINKDLFPSESLLKLKYKTQFWEFVVKGPIGKHIQFYVPEE